MIFYTHECEEKLGYSFNDKLLLRNCFTHTSYSNEHGEESNENLEFLGDSILNFTVAEYLYRAHSGNEGDMTKRRAELVSAEPIGEVVQRMGLDEFLLVGEGERKKKPKLNMCADLFEAIVAGIFLDGGLEKAKKFIYDNLLSVKIPLKNVCDNKTKFQEFVQGVRAGKISYRLLDKKGPDHAPTFISAVFVGGEQIATGEGTSKKNAEQNAASKALDILHKRFSENGNLKKNKKRAVSLKQDKKESKEKFTALNNNKKKEADKAKIDTKTRKNAIISQKTIKQNTP